MVMDPLSYGAKEDQIAANERANILKYFLGLAGSDLNNRKLDSTIFGDDSNDLKLAALDQAPATYPTTQGGLAGAFGTMANSIATFGNSVRNAKTKEEMQARKDNTVNFMGDYYNQAAAQRAALDNGLITPEAYLASMQDLKGAFWGRLQNDPRGYMINTAIRGMAMHDSAFGVDEVQRGLMQARAQAAQAEMQQNMLKTMQAAPAAASGGDTIDKNAATLKVLNDYNSKGFYDVRNTSASIPYFSADTFDQIFSKKATDNLINGYKTIGADYKIDITNLSQQAKGEFLEKVFETIDGNEKLSQEAKDQYKANVSRMADIYTNKLIQNDNESPDGKSHAQHLMLPSISGMENASKTFQLDGYNDVQQYANHQVREGLVKDFRSAQLNFDHMDTRLADTSTGNSYGAALLRNAYIDYGSGNKDAKAAKLQFLVDSGVDESLVHDFVHRTASRMGLDTSDNTQVEFLEYMLVDFLYNSIQHYSDKSRIGKVVGQLVTNLRGDTSNYATSLFSTDTNDLFRDNVQAQAGTADLGNVLFRDEESDIEHAKAIGTFIRQHAPDARAKGMTYLSGAMSFFNTQKGEHMSSHVPPLYYAKNFRK